MKTAKGKDKAKTTKEALKTVDDRKLGKSKAPAQKLSKRETRKEKKAKKDPSKPRRAFSAFMLFVQDFRETFRKENPNGMTFYALPTAVPQKWRSMSQAEKAPYEEKAAKGKAEYEKLMDAYNKNMEEGSGESEKSRSEVNDKDEASDKEEQLEKGKAGDEEEDEDDDYDAADDDDEEED